MKEYLSRKACVSSKTTEEGMDVCTVMPGLLLATGGARQRKREHNQLNLMPS